MCSADIFLGVLAVLFPPLPVWVKRGICSADSIINILLCVLGYLPGLLHAWYIIAKFPEPPYEYESLPNDREGGRVTYVYVQTPGGGCNQHQGGGSNGGMSYGTQNREGAAAAGAKSQPQQQRGPAPVKPQEQGVTRASGSADQGDSEHHDGVPPSYAEVVAGDHKVQSSD